MAVTDSFAWRYKRIAGKLITLIEKIEPIMKEIQCSSVVLPVHRQAQISMLFDTLRKGKDLTDKVLASRGWSIRRQFTSAKKMKKLEKTITSFLRVLTQILADVHLRREIDIRREIEMSDELVKVGVGLEMGKRKLKKMMFASEGGVFGISGMGGVGKTTLAREIERDHEVQRHFENQILFLTVSQSPNLEELRGRILGFLSGFEGANPVPNWNLQKLVILDDVWTTEALDCLTYQVLGCTTLVVSRSKLVDSKATYDLEVLAEDEALSLFCLCAFGQKSVPPSFQPTLVKRVADQCNGLPLALKVIGYSLKDQPETYWERVLQKLSKGEPANENHETRLLHQMEASLENLKPKHKKCFLDLCAFPEDRKIPVDVLIKMWIEIHDLEEADAFAILIDLSDKNLLILGKDPRLGGSYTSYCDIFVTQHDILRDLALHLCREKNVNERERLVMPIRTLLLPRDWERNSNKPFNAQIVSIHTGEMDATDWIGYDMEFPKAEVLILSFSAKKYALPPFISTMSRLKVLVIINNYMPHAVFQDLSVFANLSQLRSLWLERVQVPELSNTAVPLKKLHKMSLIMCKINNRLDETRVDVARIFPKLCDMTIDHCDDLVALLSSICSMTSLNSLSITNCPRLSALPTSVRKLQALEILRVHACPNLKALPTEICELPLKYLYISRCGSLNCLPEDIGKLKKLEKIDMRECNFAGRPKSAVSLESLRHIICDRDVAFMWEEVEKAVPGLKIDVAERCYSLDWLDD